MAEEIEVKTNLSGVLIGLKRNGHREKIVGIYEHWRLADEWWGQNVERDYFRVRTSRGLVCDIYRDIQSNHWYLERIYD